MSILDNKGNKCNLTKSSPSELSPNKSSASKTSPSPSKFHPNIESAIAAAVKTEMSKTDKATSSRLSPSAPEFVLPKNNLTTTPSTIPDQSKKAPLYVMPTLPGYQVYQDPRLVFQQSGGSQNPRMQPPNFEPPSLQPLSLQHPGWYLGNPVVAPPVIVPDVSTVGFPCGPTVTWSPKIMQANALAHLKNLKK